jgi:hypothetical protein
MGLPGKSKGHFIEQGPVGTRQGDTFTCCHCSRIVDVDMRERPHVCMGCFAPVCSHPHCRTVCEPFEKKLLKMEADDKKRASRNSILRAAGIDE